MAFNPDAYLQTAAFDPDAYLQQPSNAFNPDAYLGSAPKSEARQQAESSAAVLGLDTPGVREALEEYKNATGQDVPANEMDAFVGGALSGATLDFSDELYGAYKALTSSLTEDANKKHAYWDYYRFFRDSARERKAQLWDEHPVMYGAGDVAGSVATSVMLPGVGAGAKGASLATRALAAGAKALPQGLGMATADLTKGDIKGAAIETAIFGAVASIMHGGVDVVKGAITKKVTLDTIQKYGSAVLQSDAPEKALNALEKHADAEAALLRKMTQESVVFTAEEQAAVNAKGMSRLNPELQSMLKATDTGRMAKLQLTTEKAAIEEIVGAGETPAERTLLEMDLHGRVQAAANKDAALTLQRGAKKAGVSVENYIGNQWAEQTQEGLVKKLGKDRFGNLVAQMTTDKAPLLETVHALRLAQETFEHSGEFTKTLGRADSITSRWLNKFVDGREVYIALSNYHGVNATKVIDNLSQQYNKLDVIRTSIAKDVRSFDRRYAKMLKGGAIPDPNWLARMSETPAGGALPKMTPEQHSLLKDFNAITEGLAEAFGVEKQKAQAFYFPRIARDTRYIHKELSRGIVNAEKAVGKSYEDWTNAEMQGLMGDKQFKEIYDGIVYLRGGEKARPTNIADLRSAITDLRDPAAIEKSLGIYSAPLHQRLADTMPMWLRETNPSASVRKYVDSVGKYKLFTGNLAELEGFHSLMLERGDMLGASYVRNHITDISSGFRPDTAAAAFSKAEQKYTAFFDNIVVKGGALSPLASVASDLPSALHGVMANMYPVFLGGRIDAPLRNFTGAYAQLFGEMGDATYANRLMGLGAARTLRGGAKGMANLTDRGIVPVDRVTEWADSIRRSRSKTLAASQKFGEFSMSVFSWSERTARSITYHAGDAMSQDLVSALAKRGVDLTAHEASAFKASRRMFSVMDNKAIAQLAAAGDIDGVRDIVTKRLIAKTQFNYNKANASAFAREAGPYLSMFTKWPMSIAGDIKTRLTDRTVPFEKRVGGVAYKYMLPLMLLGAAGQALPGEQETKLSEDWGVPAGKQVRGPDTTGQRLMEKTLGAGKLSDYAPVMATKPFIPGTTASVFQAPLGSSIGKVFNAATKQDVDMQDRLLGVAKEAAPFMPFGSAVKLFFDVNYVLTGYNPAKPQ